MFINVTFWPFWTLKQELVHPKDPVPEKQKKGVVYSIVASAHGRTSGRTLDHRLAEHRQALRNGDVSVSAIAEHLFAAGQQVDLSKATVIYRHPPAWPDPLSPRVLAYLARTDPSQ